MPTWKNADFFLFDLQSQRAASYSRGEGVGGVLQKLEALQVFVLHF
jgi:hypothetical protein